jgi:hypothetical protein
MQKHFMIMPVFLAVLTGCAGSYQVTQPPVREADVYPGYQTISGLSVAVDEISDPDRMKQYFGTDLTKEDILPVMVIFTNHGENRFQLSPSDVLLMEGNTVLDPIPIEHIRRIVRGGTELAMQETTIPVKGRYRGLLFFKVKKKDTGLVGKVERLLIERLKMPSW